MRCGQCSASHPAGPHGRLSPQKRGKSGPHCWVREGSTQFAQQFVTAVTAPPLVGCVVWSLPIAVIFDIPFGVVLFPHLFLGTRLYFVILLKNVDKIFDWH